MDGSEHDERRRRLQRIVYGADASPEDRAAAEAELHDLADAAASSAPDDGGPTGRPDDDALAAPSVDVDPDPVEPRSSSPVRRSIMTAVVAVVVGIAIGSQIPALTTVEPASPGSDGAAGAAAIGATVSVEPGQGTSVRRSLAYEVLAREPRAHDGLPAELLMSGELDPASARLLATRSDGVASFAATTGAGADLCLIVVFSGAGSGSSCTAGGMLPAEGLQLTVGVEDDPPITAFLKSDGTAGFSAAVVPSTAEADAG